MNKNVKKTIMLIVSIVIILGFSAILEKKRLDPLEKQVMSMSLEDKVAQMMVASFRIWKEVPETEDGEQTQEEQPAVNITELNDEIREMLSRNHFGGVLLLGENFRDAEQTLRLTADLQNANRNGGGLPLMLFVDQEGGTVNRIGFSTVGVSNMALAATGDPENARKMASIHGKEIGLLGIQADFAPVTDVNNNPANPVIGVRSFSDDPEIVSKFACAFLSGLHDVGIAATLKHFPGHGNTDTDSHTGFPVINSSYEELKKCELIPFKAAIDAGADMVMSAHIQYPQIEKETYTSVSTGEQVYLPATMSRTILTDILRRDMGFEGVIVADALNMAAITDNFRVEDVVKYTINGGVDLLLLPGVKDTKLFELTQTYLDTAVAQVKAGEIDEAQINDAVLRILRMKQKYGLLDQKDFGVTEEKIAAAKDGVGSAAHRETEWQIAEKALTLVKNENRAFPIELQTGDKTLILFADSCASSAEAGEMARKLLEERQALPEGAEILVMKNTRENEEACMEAACSADHVILVHRVYAAACLNPETQDGFSSGTFDRLIDAVHEKGKTVIVVSCQLPYDVGRFPKADAVLLSYWSTPKRLINAEGFAWSANLPAGLLSCFGQGSAEGRLPINIPTLDEQYRMTDTVLYPRAEYKGLS